MKTEFKRQGDTIVVKMDGRLDFESGGPLREDLGKLIKETKKDSVPKKIIVNLESLEFVGSSGISNFVQVLKDFNTQAPIKPRYANVRTEFQQIIKAFDEEADFIIHETIEKARRSFDS